MKPAIRATIYVSLCLNLAFFTGASYGQGWTIEKLVGLAPEYDGPSCYTAALLAKGYVDTVSYVGTKELEFFLDRFCEEKSEAPKPGDFLTLTPREFHGSRPHIYHIATYLGEGQIFEKEGGIGKFEPYEKQDPRFQVRPLKDSPWFKDYRGQNYVLKSYRCMDAKIVRTKTARCEARVNALGLADLRRDFERLLLTTPAQFNPSPSNLPVIASLTQELNDLTEADPCYDYILAMGEMLGSSFKSIRIKHMAELSDEWKNARAALEHVLAKKYNIL